jgi:hypothetical protein
MQLVTLVGTFVVLYALNNLHFCGESVQNDIPKKTEAKEVQENIYKKIIRSIVDYQTCWAW